MKNQTDDVTAFIEPYNHAYSHIIMIASIQDMMMIVIMMIAE